MVENFLYIKRPWQIFLDIYHVEKFSTWQHVIGRISPHDQFFPTDAFCGVCDKYQVCLWKYMEVQPNNMDNMWLTWLMAQCDSFKISTFFLQRILLFTSTVAAGEWLRSSICILSLFFKFAIIAIIGKIAIMSTIATFALNLFRSDGAPKRSASGKPRPPGAWVWPRAVASLATVCYQPQP